MRAFCKPIITEEQKQLYSLRALLKKQIKENETQEQLLFARANSIEGKYSDYIIPCIYIEQGHRNFTYHYAKPEDRQREIAEAQILKEQAIECKEHTKALGNILKSIEDELCKSLWGVDKQTWLNFKK